MRAVAEVAEDEDAVRAAADELAGDEEWVGEIPTMFPVSSLLGRLAMFKLDLVWMMALPWEAKSRP